MQEKISVRNDAKKHYDNCLINELERIERAEIAE